MKCWLLETSATECCNVNILGCQDAMQVYVRLTGAFLFFCLSVQPMYPSPLRRSRIIVSSSSL